MKYVGDSMSKFCFCSFLKLDPVNEHFMCVTPKIQQNPNLLSNQKLQNLSIKLKKVYHILSFTNKLKYEIFFYSIKKFN